ncbi:CopL family metal-binding regulatory protein [Luteimonas sp. SDU82]|uniref:CopL family metal-binding regulatory protein n=1 Tax=Luteimonas sp. SDU82 TaxID=3422592 RepID=UPI003EC0746A
MPSALPRILLCLCLLFQGMAPAFAGLQVAIAEAASAQPPAMADCHGAEAPAPEPDPALAGQTPEDCLQHCLDLCLQQGHALGRPGLAMMPPAAGAAPSAALQPPSTPAVPFPPLRPPIA